MRKVDPDDVAPTMAPAPARPPRLGEQPTPRVIWTADLLIDTSVLSVAASARQLYDRLARQLAKMTARPDYYGRAHIPWTTLQELAAAPLVSSPGRPGRQELLSVVLNLYRELGDRLSVTADLKNMIAREWDDPPGSAAYGWQELEPQLVECVRGDGRGTKLRALGEAFTTWREEQRRRHAKGVIDLLKKYDKDPRMKEGLKHALENVGFPDILEWCDDVAAGAIEDFAKLDRAVALPRAKADPDRYYLTWTYALLTRLAQFAQSIPPKERARGPFGRYAKLLKTHRNDLVDTMLATQGARCGVLITQDAGLLERINFLQTRGFIRLQVMDFSDVEANWSPPPVVPVQP